MQTRIRLMAVAAATLLLAACDGEHPDTELAGRSGDDGAMVVYHDPSCGCCSKWIDHLQNNGFQVRSIRQTDMRDVKQQLGIPDHLASCHTAVIDGYVIEGHVPAADVKRLLEQRPDVQGLSVPGMPIGSPGMEQGDRRQAYDVLSYDESGRIESFNHYPARL